MEAEFARRRVSTIAGHFVAGEDVPPAQQHILPMNCSGSLNSVIRRCDNRMLFARQASKGQARFMRQASSADQNCSGSLNSVIRRCDNRMLFARQASGTQGYFMRQASSADQAISSAQPAAGVKCSASERPCNGYGTPLFSRPTRADLNLPRIGLVQPVAQGCSLTLPEPPPQFARSNPIKTGPKQSTSKKGSPAVANGIEWSPRMDVAESARGYVLTLEIPGVRAKDIRVEVNDRNLIVVGRRSAQSWKLAGFSSDSISSYHKREILQGPYQVVWPLPNSVNKDSVSAEFVDGFLQVIVPKL